MTNQAIDHRPPSGPGTLRIAGAIAAKDLSQILRNRNLLSVILTTLALLALYWLMPILGNDAEPAVLLVDPTGESAVTAALDNSDEIRAYSFDSVTTMAAKLQAGNVPELGLIVPDDIAAQLASADPLELIGQVNHWVSQRAAAELSEQVAAVLSAELDHPVTITIDENRVYSAQASSGLPFILALSLVVAILMVGLGMVPLLMLEEKQTRTLDALLVSPATPIQITLGKALAGMVVALVAAAIPLFVYRAVIAQWGLALTAVLGWAIWTTSLGLLVGSLVSVRQQHQTVMWLLFIPLLLPVFLLALIGLLPDWLPPYLQVVPSAASMELFQMTGMDEVPLSAAIPRLALVYGTAAILMAVVAWVIRRQQV